MKLANLILCALALTASALAQDPFDFNVSNVLLLQLKNVQQDIGVTDAQRAAMNKFADQHSAKMKALIAKEQERAKREGKSFKPNESAAREAFKSMRTGVLKTLKPTQLKRLRELTLQDVGLSALLEPSVAKRVGLAAAQVTKLRGIYDSGAKSAQAIEDKALAPIRAEFADKKPKDEAERAKLQSQLEAKIKAAATKSKPAIDKLKAGTRKQFEQVLTAEQKVAWKSLMGKLLNS